MGGEGVRLQEVEEAEELLDAVLQRSASQQHPVFHAEALESLQQFAVPVLQTVGLIDDHQSPLDVLELTVISWRRRREGGGEGEGEETERRRGEKGEREEEKMKDAYLHMKQLTVT